jgi:hypothetical protein
MNASDILKSAARPPGQRAGRTRSRVRTWLEDNQEGVRQYPPRWPILAQLLTEEGFHNDNGGPVTAAALRNIWFSIEQARRLDELKNTRRTDPEKPDSNPPPPTFQKLTRKTP